MFLSSMGHLWTRYRQRLRRRRRGCRRVLLLLILFSLAACGLLFWIVIDVLAHDDTQGTSVYLLVDNSDSTFDDATRPGTDPGMLRIEAARLFITYLGIDDGHLTHQCAITYFGTSTEQIIPLTPLTDATARADLLARLPAPEPMGWTDPLRALQTAYADIAVATDDSLPVVVLLTDGVPEWEDAAADADAYRAKLVQLGNQLTAAGVRLYVVQLVAAAGPHAAAETARWSTLWQALSERTGGRRYTAHSAEDLTDIYHDIVVTVTGKRTAGPIVQADVGAAGLRRTVEVSERTARLILVVNKGEPDQTIALLDTDGAPVAADSADVRVADNGPTAVWVVEQPAAGAWTVLVSGLGRITIWQDYVLQPLPTATPTSAPSATPLPVATPVPTAQPTREHVIVLPPIASPSPAPALPPPMLVVSEPGSQTPWGLLTAGVVLCTLGGGVGWVAWRRARPTVSGTLHVVSGPGLADGRQRLELDMLRRRAVTIGSHSADIALRAVGATTFFEICPADSVDGQHAMIVTGSEDVRVNDKPLRQAVRLADAMTLTIGETTLRYENLRLRQAQRTVTQRALKNLSQSGINQSTS